MEEVRIEDFELEQMSRIDFKKRTDKTFQAELKEKNAKEVGELQKAQNWDEGEQLVEVEQGGSQIVPGWCGMGYERLQGVV